MDDDVFSKYVVVNGDWELRRCVSDVGIRELWGMSLGSEMMARCLDVGCVGSVVKSEVVKFKDVYEYYVRRVYRRSDFIVYSGINYTGSGRRDVIFRGYNVDPWGREFPCYMDGVYSNYYRFSGNKVRYGYWLVYKDRFITSNYNNFIDGRVLDNVAPLMVLTTTSLDGVTVGCLDMVDGE